MSERELPKGMRWHRGRIQARALGTDSKEIAKTFDRLTDARDWKESIDTDQRRGTLVDERRGKTKFE